MYAYIKGIFEYCVENNVVVDVSGVGYKISVPVGALSRLPKIGDSIKLYTYLNIREDAMELYGFLLREELNMFELLISVSGVGPKVALGILSGIEPSKFALSVVTNDIKTITRAPGVGNKLAQRMVLELKDKFKNKVVLPEGVVETTSGVGGTDLSEAVEALMVLGYSASEAALAVTGLNGTLEEIISEALKKQMRQV